MHRSSLFFRVNSSASPPDLIVGKPYLFTPLLHSLSSSPQDPVITLITISNLKGTLAWRPLCQDRVSFLRGKSISWLSRGAKKWLSFFPHLVQPGNRWGAQELWTQMLPSTGGKSAHLFSEISSQTIPTTSTSWSKCLEHVCFSSSYSIFLNNIRVGRISAKKSLNQVTVLSFLNYITFRHSLSISESES